MGGSWVVGRGSWVVGRGSWVVGRGSWVVGRGSWVVGRGSWVVGRGSCLFENKREIVIYISPLSAPSKFAIARSRIHFPVLLYETLNKGKLSPINYKSFSFWPGKQSR